MLLKTVDPTPLEWRKSASSNGATTCVEPAWRKSSLSSSNTGCVELAWEEEMTFLARDSKHVTGPVLSFPANALDAFLANICKQEVNQPS